MFFVGYKCSFFFFFFFFFFTTGTGEFLLVLQNRTANGSDQSETEFRRFQELTVADGSARTCMEEYFLMIFPHFNRYNC